METALCVVGVIVLGVVLLVVLSACKVSGDIEDWERRDCR